MIARPIHEFGIQFVQNLPHPPCPHAWEPFQLDVLKIAGRYYPERLVQPVYPTLTGPRRARKTRRGSAAVADARPRSTLVTVVVRLTALRPETLTLIGRQALLIVDTNEQVARLSAQRHADLGRLGRIVYQAGRISARR